MDGGLTWTIEKPSSLLAPPGTVSGRRAGRAGGMPVTDCPGGIDFTNPNFIVTFRMADVDIGPSPIL